MTAFLQPWVHYVSGTGFDEDILGVASGKDFALVRLASGKVICLILINITIILANPCIEISRQMTRLFLRMD